NEGGVTRQYMAPVEVSAEGSYVVTVKGSTRADDPSVTTTVGYNFVGLRNPNTRPPLPGAPSVIHVTPGDGAENVDLTTDIRLDFSEPVRNLRAGQTVYLQEEGQEEKIGGVILSGGVTVQPDTPGISSVVFKPSAALSGGRKYSVHVTTEVADDTGLGLDQQYAGEGDTARSPFASSFQTFAGLVLTEQPLADTSTRITVVGNYAYTVRPYSTNNLVSKLTVYDISEPQRPVVRGSLIVPQWAFDLSVTESERDAFTVDGRVYTRVAAVAAAQPRHPEQHANVWFIGLDDPAAPELIGVTSLYLPQALPSNPLSVRLHGGRAYVGSAPYRGISVVDVAKSVRLFNEAKRKGLNPIVDAVRAPGGTTGLTQSGQGQTAKIQTVTAEVMPVLSGLYAAPSISVMEQFASKTGIAPGNMPFVYAANNSYLRLLEVAFPFTHDGRNGHVWTQEKQHDDRIFSMVDVDPKTPPALVRTAPNVLVGSSHVNLALLLGGGRMWIFDVTMPGNPSQY
ncbi:MAG TPA: Ig-like domain-containing protein, partial [Pyrinomonadaceae bacterium]|nr:Ig-like domain-containing protein [Pyrinomonadaceae bacterium]